MIILGAFVLRMPRLAARPMHADEAVHAVKLGTLLETGVYTYNPHEYHGPTIYWLTMPFLKLAGVEALADIEDETPLRLAIVLTGVLLCAAPALWRRSLGRREVLWAALLLAVSPAFVFYGRYYIQEVPFVLFSLLTMIAASRAAETRSRWRAALAGVPLGLMIATKETWMLLAGTALISAWLLHITYLGPRRRSTEGIPWRTLLLLVACSAVSAIFVGTLVLSHGFTNPAAYLGLFEAMLGYIQRGTSGDSSTFGSSIHDHPWWYYIHLLSANEGPRPFYWTEVGTLLLGLAGGAAIIMNWQRTDLPWRFLLIYTILLTAFYSSIPYKTPWNCLPFYLGWVLLAARGCTALSELAPRGLMRAAACAGLLVWPWFMGVQSWRSVTRYAADPRLPYAYSPTAPDLLRLAQRGEQLAAVSPKGHDMLIYIAAPDNDYWPLPWYWRRFPNLGFYTELPPAMPRPDIAVVAADWETAAAEQYTSYTLEYNGLRPDVMLASFIEPGVWQLYLDSVSQNP